MYSYVDSFLRAYGKNQTWKSVNIATMLMKNIMQAFFDGYIILTANAGTYYLDINALKRAQETLPYLPGLTFTQWLSYLDTTVLPTLPTQPVYTTTNVVYSSAAQAVFSVNRFSLTGSDDNDLQLLKDDIDYTLLHTHVLTSVNGYYHRNIPIEGGVAIPSGALSGDVSRRYQVGLVSFAGIGAVQQVAFNQSMFSRPSTNIPYAKQVYVNLGVSLVGKSVLLSLGGYLHCNDKTYDIINEAQGIIAINLNKISIVERLMEMRRYLDISSIGLSVSTIRPTAISVLEAMSDETAFAFLELPQSFAVVVDTPMLYIERRVLRPIGTLVGLYDSNIEPLFPLRTNTGRQLEYHRTQEFNVWTINCCDNVGKNPLFRTTEWQNDKAVTEGPDEHRAFIPDAHLYGIYSTVQTA